MKTGMRSMTLTKDEMNKRCVRGTLDLCERCVRVLPAATKPLAETEECATTTTTATTTTHYSTNVLLDFIRFTNCCANIPILSEAWIASISSNMDDLERVRESIAQVMKSLASVPIVFKDKDATQLNDGDVKKEKGIKSVGAFGRLDMMQVASVRKGAKSLLLMLEGVASTHVSNATIHSQQVRSRRVSSKTD